MTKDPSWFSYCNIYQTLIFQIIKHIFLYSKTNKHKTVIFNSLTTFIKHPSSISQATTRPHYTSYTFWIKKSLKQNPSVKMKQSKRSQTSRHDLKKLKNRSEAQELTSISLSIGRQDSKAGLWQQGKLSYLADKLFTAGINPQSIHQI